uniref:Uncharacterized protein n=1 Tax=Odontella aurita TaxID=265563 RepID=A0A7S4M934_9STRA
MIPSIYRQKIATASSPTVFTLTKIAAEPITCRGMLLLLLSVVAITHECNAATCPSFLESGAKHSEPSLGSTDTCDLNSPDDEPFFSRVETSEEMADPNVS